MKLHFPPQIEGQKGEVRQKQEAPKMLPPLEFRKQANHKSRNARAQSEHGPQNEARFADCAIFGDRRLFRNAEVALAFLGKPSVKLLGENRPMSNIQLVTNLNITTVIVMTMMMR